MLQAIRIYKHENLLREAATSLYFNKHLNIQYNINYDVLSNVALNKTKKFPAGELNFSLPETFLGEPIEEHHVLLQVDLKTSDDIIELLLAVNAVRVYNPKSVHLYIPYFPYARQDRICNEGESFSLKVIADLINNINADSVTIHDPHSDVTPALLNNVNVIEQKTLIDFHPDITYSDKLVICPDAGAEKKIQKLKTTYVMGTKVRDPKTGKILKTKVYDENNLINGKDCVIIDDICDGGRTFIELAKVLREKGAAKVDLYVTHGIFSKGFDVFEGLIDNIYYYELDKPKHEIISTGETK